MLGRLLVVRCASALQGSTAPTYCCCCCLDCSLVQQRLAPVRAKKQAAEAAEDVDLDMVALEAETDAVSEPAAPWQVLSSRVSCFCFNAARA